MQQYKGAPPKIERLHLYRGMRHTSVHNQHAHTHLGVIPFISSLSVVKPARQTLLRGVRLPSPDIPISGAGAALSSIRVRRFGSFRFQMVHTEPFFSRKDDVPERRREFAGKVYRIPHKDDLQVRHAREGFWGFCRAV